MLKSRDEDIIKEKPPRGREMPTIPDDSGRICYEGYVGNVKYTVPDENLEHMKEDVSAQILTRGLSALTGEKVERLAPSKYDRATRKLNVAVDRGTNVLDPDATFTFCVEDLDEEDIEDEKQKSDVPVQVNKKKQDKGKDDKMDKEKKRVKEEKDKKINIKEKEEEKKIKYMEKEGEKERKNIHKEKDNGIMSIKVEEKETERVILKDKPKEEIKLQDKDHKHQVSKVEEPQKGIHELDIDSNKWLSQDKQPKKRVSQDNVFDKESVSHGKVLDQKIISEENKTPNIRGVEQENVNFLQDRISENVCKEEDDKIKYGEENPSSIRRSHEMSLVARDTDQEKEKEYKQIKEQDNQKKYLHEEDVGEENNEDTYRKTMRHEIDKSQTFEFNESKQKDSLLKNLNQIEVEENADYWRYEESQGKETIQEQKTSKEEKYLEKIGPHEDGPEYKNDAEKGKADEECKGNNQNKEKSLGREFEAEVKANSHEEKVVKDEVPNEDYMTDDRVIGENDNKLLNDILNVDKVGKNCCDQAMREHSEQSEGKSCLGPQKSTKLLPADRLRLLISGHFREDKKPIFIIQGYNEKTDIFQDQKVDFQSKRKLSERGVDAVILGRFYDEPILEESDGRPAALNIGPHKILIDQESSKVYNDHFKEVYNLESVEVLLTGEFLKSGITKRITPFLSLALRTGVTPGNMTCGEDQKVNTTTMVYTCQLKPSEPFPENLKG